MSRIDEWLDQPDLQNARFTSAFRAQLDELTIQRRINPFAVLDEIKALEGAGHRPSNTKKPTEFKRGLLKGLMHKHFFNARHMPTNLLNHWENRPDKMEKAIRKAAESAPSQDIWHVAGAIADRVVRVAFEHKNLERSLTGDWIIYKRHGGRNYYLCLAEHGETNEAIYDRFASAAENEFPEIGIKAQSPFSESKTG